MYKEFLIGFTKDYEVIMAEIGIRDWNYKNEFIAAFTTSRIVKRANKIIYNEDYMGGGQHDTRDELLYAIDKELYDDIHYLWDNYHKKQLDDKGFELYNSIIERASKIDEGGEIEKFIKEYLDERD